MRNIAGPAAGAVAAACSICKKRAYCGLLSTAGVLRGRWAEVLAAASSVGDVSNNVWNIVYLLIGFFVVVVMFDLLSNAKLLVLWRVAPPLAAVLFGFRALVVIFLQLFSQAFALAS